MKNLLTPILLVTIIIITFTAHSTAQTHTSGDTLRAWPVADASNSASYAFKYPGESTTAYGEYVNPYDYIGAYLMPGNDTFVANTGWRKLSTTKNVVIVDSLRYGWSAIVGDSVNTDGLQPGMYNYKLAYKCPLNVYNTFWVDTVARSVVIVKR